MAKKTIKAKTNNELYGVQPLADYLGILLQSAWLKPYAPVSGILVAKPESAKTTALALHSNYKWVYYTNEITAKMLIDVVFEKASKKEIRFLVIPDLLNCTEKQKSSKESFVNLVKSGIEEGLNDIQTYYKKISSDEPIKFGLLTAITSENMKDTARYFKNIGFTSRLVPFSYSYGLDKVSAIMDAIIGKSKLANDVVIKPIIQKEMQIEGNPALFEKVRGISMAYGVNFGGFGARMQKNLQRMMMANAMLNGRKKVTEEDANKVMELANWLNFNFRVI